MVATRKQTAVVGVFHDRDKARECVAELRKAGFSESEIGVVSREDSTATEGRVSDQGSAIGTGAATGLAAGAGIGAAWALGIAAGLLPAIGPVVAGGLLGSLLASAAGGAAAGGLVGALIGLGIPEDEAEFYDEEFRAGRTLVTVKTENRIDEAQAILRRYGAYDMQTKAAASSQGTTATESRMSSSVGTPHATRTDSGSSIELREEQLTASKQPVQTGEVRISKDVTTEQKTLQVPVQREEVVIERRPAHGPATSSEIREGEEIRIPVKEEEVHLHKQAVVKEQVNVGKRKVQETENVSGTVRKEELHVEQEGDVDVHGRSARNPRR